jgi:hypothetical protein
VIQQGTTTVNGTQAIALSVTLPSAEDLDYTLHVDAQTYQPLRTVTVGTSAGAPVTPSTITPCLASRLTRRRSFSPRVEASR